MGEGPGENKGFKVIDRRSSAVETPSAESAKPEQPPPETARSPAPPPAEAEGVLGPIDFGTFLVSLASSALIHLGEAAEPETGEARVSLPHAKQTIDLLALLQEKTKGNLTDEESKLLQALLRDLRLRFVNAAQKRAE